jgi:hypothetical protein
VNVKLGEVNRKTSERPLLLDHQKVRSVMRNRAQRLLELIFPNRRKAERLRPEPPRVYEPPRLTRLTPEQAKLKLLGHLSVGEKGAKDLLDLLFSEPVADATTPEQERLHSPN